MKPNVLKEKSFDFALQIVLTYKMLSSEKREWVLSKQLLRSGTSIGANISEAQYAQSKADFISKLSIALKEANETNFWLQLLYKSEYIETSVYEVLDARLSEQLRLLTSIINTSKNNY